jgi:hypothetical protein
LRLGSFYPTSKKEACDVPGEEEQGSGQFKWKGSAYHCVLGAFPAAEKLSTDRRDSRNETSSLMTSRCWGVQTD